MKHIPDDHRRSNSSAVSHALYDGRERIGSVVKDGAATFRAFDRHGKPIGTFHSVRAAADAVIAAAEREVLS